MSSDQVAEILPGSSGPTQTAAERPVNYRRSSLKLRGALLLALLVAPAVGALAQSREDAKDSSLALPYCQYLVNAILAKKRDDVYQHVSPRMKRHFSEDEMLKVMDLTPTMFGEVTTPKLSTQGRGFFEAAGERFDTLTCEYSVTSTKVSTGMFMRIQIDRAAPRHDLVSYQIFNRIPL